MARLIIRKIRLKVLAGVKLFLLAASIAAAQQGRVVEPAWEKALGGNAACPPVAFRGRVYILSVDRSITCLDETGDFLWRKPLKSRQAPRLSLSKSGVLCVFGRNGEISAFTSSGSQLWTYSGMRGSLPVLDPYEGRDGRLFILYENEIVCIAANGSQKWKARVNGRGAKMLSEDGQGNTLIINSEGNIIPVSPWGEVFSAFSTGLDIRRALSIEGNACALFSAEGSSGCKITAASFNPSRREAGAPDILWETGGLSQLAAAISLNGKIYFAGTDGKLIVIDSSDGSVLSDVNFYARGSVSGASLFHSPNDEGDRIILLAQEMCIAFSEEGEVLWQVAFSQPLLNPVFTEGGYAVSAPQDSVVTGFQVELEPKREKAASEDAPRRESYAIFDGKSLEYRIPQTATFSYFEATRKKIASGNLGRDERDISRRLAEILNGDTGNYYSSVQFDVAQRSLAAELLGLMGSEEARDVLIAATRRETDPTVLTGILRGLSSLAPDSGRRTLDAVLRVLHKNTSVDEIVAAACDALYAIALGAYGETAVEAATAIHSCTGVQYNPAARIYASRLVEKLIQ